MYKNDPKLKKQRVKAQLKKCLRLNFTLTPYINKLSEIIMDDEEIYGGLSGRNVETGNFDVIIVTNYNVYIFDTDKIFTQGFTQFPPSSFRSIRSNGTLFGNFKVTIVIDRYTYDYEDCYQEYYETFRKAIHNAKHNLGVPYEFDRTPYEQEQSVTQEYQEPVRPQKTAKQLEKEERERKELLFAEQLEREREKKALIAERNKMYEEEKPSYTFEQREYAKKVLDGSADSDRNVYFYADFKGAGFTQLSDGTFMKSLGCDSDFKVFYERTGLTPNYTDFNYLHDNEKFIKKLLVDDEFGDYLYNARKGKGYLIKQEYGFKPEPVDYLAENELEDYLLNAQNPSQAKAETLIKSNHIASRFLKEQEDDSEEVIKTPELESEQDESIDFDFDFSALDEFSNEVNGYTEQENQKSLEQTEQFTDVNEQPETNDSSVANEPEYKEPAEVISDLQSLHKEKENIVMQLQTYKQLFDLDIITESEYLAKRDELLNKI